MQIEAEKTITQKAAFQKMISRSWFRNTRGGLRKQLNKRKAQRKN